MQVHPANLLDIHSVSLKGNIYTYTCVYFEKLTTITGFVKERKEEQTLSWNNLHQVDLMTMRYSTSFFLYLKLEARRALAVCQYSSTYKAMPNWKLKVVHLLRTLFVNARSPSDKGSTTTASAQISLAAAKLAATSCLSFPSCSFGLLRTVCSYLLSVSLLLFFF